jgi:hypothetical protein
MKITRCAGRLLFAVVVLCVLATLLTPRVDAQSAELSGAVNAVRQAEKQADDRELKASLGEAAKALKRAQKLAAKGQTAPLLDELSSVHKKLLELVDAPQNASSHAVPSIERAVGLIEGTIRKAGGYRTSTDTALGLHTTSLASLHGTVRVYLPEDIRVGDAISGAVEIEPAGATPEERQRNGATLSGVVITLEEEETPASEGSVYWQVPVIEYGTPATLVLRDPNGVEVGRTTVPVNPVPDSLGTLHQPLPGDYELPPIVQFGNPFTITGPFDGEFVTSALDCGGELSLLAESPRALIARAPIDLVGQHPMTLSEGDTLVTRDVNVIQLHLSAGKLDLLKGETTVVTAEVTGFAGLDPEAYPIEFEMINHSPETVTMEGLEDNRFYRLIYADDISILDDVSPEGSFVVESTLHGVRTGTFNISATVTSPILFDVLGPGEQLECSDEKRYRLLCVRFIILDAPGAKDRQEDGSGLLEGVSYNGKNVGKVSPATIAKVRAALEKANAIWLQCFAHCCWIQFELHSVDGRPAVYALDPKGKPVVFERERRIVHGPSRGKVKVTGTIDLTQFLDRGNSRGITMQDGGSQGTIQKRVNWDQDVGADIKKGDSAAAAARQAAGVADDERTKGYYQRLAQKQRTATLNVLDTFGQLIDQELGAKCINIILVDSLEDTGKTGDASGFATIGGRNIFLEDSELDSDTGAVLAHELGHNLGLDHVDEAGRLMNGSNAGATLAQDECETACSTAASEALQPAGHPEDEAKKRHDALEEARTKEKEAREAAEEEAERKEEEAAERSREIEKIDERLGEIDRRMAELEEKIAAAEEGFRKSIEEMEGQSEAEKRKFLEDNLPSRARKEKAELEKLTKEKAELEGQKAGLQD